MYYIIVAIGDVAVVLLDAIMMRANLASAGVPLRSDIMIFFVAMLLISGLMNSGPHGSARA